jgi:hypothetical protein
MKTSAQNTPVQRTRKAPAKPVQKPRAAGSLTRGETTNLVMAAQEAFNYQLALKRVDPATTFDAWRRDQVMESVGLAGISKIGRSHFRTVKAHFLTLAGRDDEAFGLLNRTGQKTDHGNPADTHESAEAIVAKIREALRNHATVPADRLQPGKTHIHAGWLIAAARQRTAKPTLTMDTLADRLTPTALVGLLAHLRSHIARREGRAADHLRKPRTYPKKTVEETISDDTPF